MSTSTPPKKHATHCHANGISEAECCCDGYHTFNELYEHRHALFIALCRHLSYQVNVSESGERSPHKIWRAKFHSDGSEYDGWFILGINQEKGKQITYHLPMVKWDECDFATDLGRAPEWDSHTPYDVLNRLKSI